MRTHRDHWRHTPRACGVSGSRRPSMRGDLRRHARRREHLFPDRHGVCRDLHGVAPTSWLGVMGGSELWGPGSVADSEPRCSSEARCSQPRGVRRSARRSGRATTHRLFVAPGAPGDHGQRSVRRHLPLAAREGRVQGAPGVTASLRRVGPRPTIRRCRNPSDPGSGCPSSGPVRPPWRSRAGSCGGAPWAYLSTPGRSGSGT